MNELPVHATFEPDHPLQQAGITVDEPAAHHQDNDLDLMVLGHPTLLRMHSLQAAGHFNAALEADQATADWQLPERVNGAKGNDPSVLCLAPGEWLWFSEYLRPEVLRQQMQEPLRGVLDGRLTSLLDQSAAFAVFRLSGPAAAWLLSKCCGLDFRAATRQGQHCSRTRLNQAPAIFHYHRPGNGSGAYVFDVLVERGLARYSWQLLQRLQPHAMELLQQHGPLD
jgi:heterotetrameric sarcosine oxidase gamma subunit